MLFAGYGVMRLNSRNRVSVHGTEELKMYISCLIETNLLMIQSWRNQPSVVPKAVEFKQRWKLQQQITRNVQVS